jgi:hypothetical protein
VTPFGNGTPDRRKRDTALPGGRRDDDPDVEMAARFGFWAKLFVVHRAKVMAVLMIASTIAGAMATSALLAPRVTRLEGAVAVLQTDVNALKESEETKMYILCTLLRRTDPAALPTTCNRNRTAALLNLINDALTP